MNNKKFGKLLLILLLPGGVLLSYISSFSPSLIEGAYSNGFNKITGQILSTITGVLPFSLAELVILFLVIFVIYSLVSMIVKAVKGTFKKRYIILNYFINLLVFVSIIYFTFIIIWGLNYHRLPFSIIAKLDVQSVSVKELGDICEIFINRANTLRNSVNQDSNGFMDIQGGYRDVFNRTFKGYEKAAMIYPELGGRYGIPKGVILSQAMSYAGISGVYFPFTGEANVNIDSPDSEIPFTACHEMAHQRGFAREDEANYIAYLACIMSPDRDFQYSGTLLAQINLMNTLYSYDRSRYDSLKQTYSKAVAQDLSEIAAFWHKYQGPIERISTKINDTYLKANNQKDGVYSYGRMVDLLIAEYRKNKANPQNIVP